MRVAAHPGLYDPDRPEPTLRGTRCDACERVWFPPVVLGCPQCGAVEDQLIATELVAAGRLHSVATVHRHRVKGFDGPFAVGEIQLDDGPLVRATLAVSESEVALDQRVVATWVTQRIDDDGNEVVEPRFGPGEGGAA
jgi:uncharacterized protein